MEVEFPSEEEAAGFILPEWTRHEGGPALDVTADKCYKNKALAVNGWPS